MGLFDLFDDIIDAVVDGPAEILEKGAEAITRIPEAGIKAVKGVAKGIEKGINKIGDTLD